MMCPRCGRVRRRNVGEGICRFRIVLLMMIVMAVDCRPLIVMNRILEDNFHCLMMDRTARRAHGCRKRMKRQHGH